jgi:glycosyltransferase involved in cell wall biosynthesis
MKPQKHKVVFLYSELAGYFIACAKNLSLHPGVESVHILHWPLHPEAPFKFESTSNCTLYPKARYSRRELTELINELDPTAIVCCGWMDRDYNFIAKEWQKKIPVVLTLDNWWTGSVRQWLGVLTAPFFIKKRFNRVWIPGEPQQPFAERFGFNPRNLAHGWYCADPVPFLNAYESRQSNPASKKILYVGRYIELKGITELWRAFIKLSPEFPAWELHCIGTGELWQSRAQHPKIFHHGFKQPHELLPFIEDAACFVMPSKREPWGVVLHEMAIAGVPLLASSMVGATTLFLESGVNGVLFENPKLSDALRQFMTLPNSKRVMMSRRSHERGMRHNLDNWNESILKLISR